MAKDAKPQAKPQGNAKPKSAPTSGAWSQYEVKGSELKHNATFCPKCGAGAALAQHKDRKTCGKCFYTEFQKK